MATVDTRSPKTVDVVERSAPLLRAENLVVAYDRVVTAVQGVSLEVQSGSITAIIGMNGAGKTTTLQAIAGFMGGDRASLRSGQIFFKGEQIDGKPPHYIARLGIGLVPERLKIFTGLTVDENLRASEAGSAKRARHVVDIEGIYELFPVLTERRRHVSGYLSGGERQMLALAMGLLGSPDLLMIDEMTLGLSPVASSELGEFVASLRESFGISLLIVEQNALLASEIADYAYVLETGRVVFDGAMQELIDHRHFQEFYLGIGAGEQTRSYRDVKGYRQRRRWT